jgi:hypothetical protein
MRFHKNVDRIQPMGSYCNPFVQGENRYHRMGWMIPSNRSMLRSIEGPFLFGPTLYPCFSYQKSLYKATRHNLPNRWIKWNRGVQQRMERRRSRRGSQSRRGSSLHLRRFDYTIGKQCDNSNFCRYYRMIDTLESVAFLDHLHPDAVHDNIVCSTFGNSKSRDHIDSSCRWALFSSESSRLLHRRFL